jgi:hypothetical protein
VWLFLDGNALVAVLEEMTRSTVAKIESHRMARHEAPHEDGERLIAQAQKKVKVVREQAPTVQASPRLVQKLAQPVRKAHPVPIVPKNLPPLDPSCDDVIDQTRNVESRLPRHGRSVDKAGFRFNMTLQNYLRPLMSPHSRCGWDPVTHRGFGLVRDRPIGQLQYLKIQGE